MDKPFKFILPSPSFDKKSNNSGNKVKPHFLTPSGMTLLPREKQPPPMYGKRGATVPAKYLNAKPLEQPVAMVEQPIKQYCEPCEMELQSMEDFRRHRAQHETCPVAGCQYKGHPTVMDKHINALHSSGLFDKFKKLNSPEEIAAWREERRKRFPTVANVLLKQKAQEQRQKRGERLEASRNRFGNVEDRKRAQSNKKEMTANEDEKSNLNNSRNNKRNKNNRNKNNQRGNRDRKDYERPKNLNEEKPKKTNEEIAEEISWHGLEAFHGTLQMKDYKHIKNNPKQETQNVLFGLLGMYGSDNESEEEEPEEVQEDCNKRVEAPNETVINTAGDILEKNVEEVVENNLKEKIQESMETEICFEKITEEKSTTMEAPCPSSKEKLSDDQNLPNNGNSSDEAPEETAIERSIPEFKQEAPKVNPMTTNASASEKSNFNNNQRPKKEPPKPKPQLKRKSGLDYRKLKMRKQNTMLEKLLESDIRHERNVLLQCVRYVCENNFFGVGSNKSTSIG